MSRPSSKPVQNRNRFTPLHLFAMVVPLAVYLGHAGVFWPQINDDAYITFRYAKFLALGRGPYFNLGEPVEGYTNFLMVPVMALVWRVGGDGAVLPAAKLLGILGGALAVVASGILTRRMLLAFGTAFFPAGWSILLGSLASLFTALNSAFALNSTTGLETTLFAGLVTAGLALTAGDARRGRRRWAGICFALAALTRPEGIVLFAVVAAGVTLSGGHRDPDLRKQLGRDALLVGIVVGLHLIFRLAFYDGQFVPNTYHAKSGGMPEQTAEGYLFGFARNHLAARDPLAALIRLLTPCAAPLLAWLALRSSTGTRPAGPPPEQTAAGKESAPSGQGLFRVMLPATGVLLFGVTSVFFTGPDWMPGYRLFVPYIPAASALSVVALAAICACFTPRRAGEWALVFGLPMAGWLFMAQWPTLAGDLDSTRIRAQGYRSGHMALAEWLAANADKDDTVALMDIGIIGFLNPDLRLLDITGLTDRHIARSPGPFLGKVFDPAYVFNQRPRYLVITLLAPLNPDGTDDFRALKPFTPIEERLVSDPAFTASYWTPCEPGDEATILERLACATGATRVFRHNYPGFSYFLAVFERHDALGRKSDRNQP